MTIRAIDDIEDFSDVRVSYISILSEKTEVRRTQLSSHYFFLCECKNCSNGSQDILKSSLNCLNCGGCVPTATGNL